jgi:hypothetical protein
LNSRYCKIQESLAKPQRFKRTHPCSISPLLARTQPSAAAASPCATARRCPSTRCRRCARAATTLSRSWVR